MPLSTKKQDRYLHGYGVSSMKYIVEKYGGGMNISAENSRYMVSIVIPQR